MGRLILIYLAAANVLTFLLYGLDKLLAKREGARRIRERTLLLAAVFGGSIGAIAGMKLFRHKTLHKKFRYGLPLILFVQLALFAWWVYHDLTI
ncbi:MAG: DUF1294 domain-containing protein [Oscillospiraceae bacterium]|nr:DUF1294 domain-containing protein [Oscillospiraceae bacterium]